MCRDAIDRVRPRRHSPTRTRSIASLHITRKDGEPLICFFFDIQDLPFTCVKDWVNSAGGSKIG